MINARDALFWTIMLCYSASILACLTALFRGWRAGHLFVGPKSIVYLSPFANIFLGLGFILSAFTSHPGTWRRILFIAVGLFQFFPAWKIWKRRQTLKRADPASAT